MLLPGKWQPRAIYRDIEGFQRRIYGPKHEHPILAVRLNRVALKANYEVDRVVAEFGTYAVPRIETMSGRRPPGHLLR